MPISPEQRRWLFVQHCAKNDGCWKMSSRAISLSSRRALKIGLKGVRLYACWSPCISPFIHTSYTDSQARVCALLLYWRVTVRLYTVGTRTYTSSVINQIIQQWSSNRFQYLSPRDEALPVCVPLAFFIDCCEPSRPSWLMMTHFMLQSGKCIGTTVVHRRSTLDTLKNGNCKK